MLDTTAVFASFPVLETERLRLRAVKMDDAEAIFRALGDPEVVRYFGVAPMASLGEAKERVMTVQNAYATQKGIRWVITWRKSDEYLGSCAFWRLIKEHYAAELGYELARDYWGQGVMPEAVSAVLNYGFATMGLHRVEAHIHPDNTGSRRVLEKLGFVREGYFREAYYEPTSGLFTDTAVYSLLQANWRDTAHSGMR